MLLFSPSVMSASLRPHGLQHIRLPCPSPCPQACSNSCPLSQWCHPTISSSVIPFSSLLLPSLFSSTRVFSNELALCIRWPKWSTGVSTSASVLPMNIQDWFPLGLTGLISLLSKGLKSLLQPHSLKASVIQCSVFFMVQFSHPYMTTGKTGVVWGGGKVGGAREEACVKRLRASSTECNVWARLNRLKHTDYKKSLFI